MARRLRLESAGAIYHVINRGNYRRDVFDSVGAALAFEKVLDETCVRFGWQVYAYVVMRNHFHLALQTPQPNLVEGMHWLQSTFATRFNRFRTEQGHLFQGRYQALLIENTTALLRVVDYIHLNPVRADIVGPEFADSFRWSSLPRVRRDRPRWLNPQPWLEHLGLADDLAAWKAYSVHLADVATQSDPDQEERELCRGWAIGTHGWRSAVAKDHQHLSLNQGIARDELRELKRARWHAVLEQRLRDADKTEHDLQLARKGAEWKCVLAQRLRDEASAPYAWIAETLHMGNPNSVRSLLCVRRRAERA